VKEWAQEDELY